MAGGQQINAGQGTILGGPSQAISGSEAASAAGAGVAASLVKLASRKVGGGTATFQLAGQASAAIAGTLLGGPGQILIGTGLTATQGTFAKARSVAPSGQVATASPGTVGAPANGTAADADWADRQASPGTWFAQNFPTAASVTSNVWTQGSGQNHVSWDTTIKLSGSGSAKLLALASDDGRTNPVGTGVTPAYGTGQGQIRLPFDGGSGSDPFHTSTITRGPGSDNWYVGVFYTPTALLQHKPQHSRNIDGSGGIDEQGGGFKMLWVSGGGTQSNTGAEIVTNNRGYGGVVDSYFNGGLFLDSHVQVATPNDSSNFRLTNAIDAGGATPTTDTEYQRRYGSLLHNRDAGYALPNLGYVPNSGDVFAQGYPDTNVLASGVKRLQPDGYNSIMLHVKYGTKGIANSTVEVYRAHYGTQWVMEQSTTTARLDTDDHGAFWISNYDTSRIPNTGGVVDTAMYALEFMASSMRINAPGATPAWLRGKARSTWFQISGLQLANAMGSYSAPGGSKAGITAYSGMTVKPSGSELIVIGGGHADYAGNECITLRLQDDVPAWVLRRAPTATVGLVSDPGTAYYSDGRPSSRHSGERLLYSRQRNRAMLFGGWALWGNGNGSTAAVDGFNLSTNDYDAAGTYPNVPFNQNNPIGCCMDDLGNVYMQDSTGQLVRWNQSTNTWTNFGFKNNSNTSTPLCFDPINRRVVRFALNFGRYYSETGVESAPITFTGSASSAMGGNFGATAVVWCDDLRTFLLMKNGDAASPGTAYGIYTCDPNTFDVQPLSASGTGPTYSNQDGFNNNYGRFNYLPELGVVVYVRTTTDDLFFFRTR